MMAASARMSGTTLPLSSNLKRGCMASRWAAAACAARLRATVARRVAAVLFRATGFRAVVAVFLVVDADFVAVEPVAALVRMGSPTAETNANTQMSLAAAEDRVRITGKPLRDRLLRNVSAL